MNTPLRKGRSVSEKPLPSKDAWPHNAGRLSGTSKFKMSNNPGSAFQVRTLTLFHAGEETVGDFEARTREIFRETQHMGVTSHAITQGLEEASDPTSIKREDLCDIL